MKHWSEVDDAAVRQHFVVEQKSYGQIALLYDGATVGAVAGRCRRLGLKRGTSRTIGVKLAGRGGPVLAPVTIPPPKPARVIALSVVAMRQEKQRREFLPGKVRLEDLESHSCRWPVGDPGDAGFGFCGKRREADVPYCCAHKKMAYTGTKYEKQLRRPRGA